MRRIKGLRHWIDAFCASLVYGFPGQKLKVIGVTGTDGKTTTCFYLYEILKAAGKKTALITSIGAKIDDETLDTGLHVTTPESFALQKLLRKIVNEDCQYLVLEVTSHGLDQHRVWGIPFEIGVLTNITHEHLDYHGTFQNYLLVKAKLFKIAKISVLNRDDSASDFLKKLSKKVVSYSLENKEADLKKQDLLDKLIQINLAGDYNWQNALAAAATADTLGIGWDKIKEGIESVKFIPGRMEEIDEGQDFKVIVDFAHTPNGLEKSFLTVREMIGQGRVIAVFGCAGERDWQKRPLMGEIATQLADLVVLTAEDPRGESLELILEQIALGCRRAGGVEGKTFWKISDRQSAIEFAINSAKAGDVVIITGKGHERSMCFGKTEYPWSDFEAVKKALATRSD